MSKASTRELTEVAAMLLSGIQVEEITPEQMDTAAAKANALWTKCGDILSAGTTPPLSEFELQVSEAATNGRVGFEDALNFWFPHLSDYSDRLYELREFLASLTPGSTPQQDEIYTNIEDLRINGRTVAQVCRVRKLVDQWRVGKVNDGHASEMGLGS